MQCVGNCFSNSSGSLRFDREEEVGLSGFVSAVLDVPLFVCLSDVELFATGLGFSEELAAAGWVELRLRRLRFRSDWPREKSRLRSEVEGGWGLSDIIFEFKKIFFKIHSF